MTAFCHQIPQLVNIAQVGNQKENGDALAAITACVVRGLQPSRRTLNPLAAARRSCCPALPFADHAPISLFDALLFQNLCSNDAAPQVFAKADVFHRIGPLLASSKSAEFVRTGCMYLISFCDYNSMIIIAPQNFVLPDTCPISHSSLLRLLSNTTRSETEVLNLCNRRAAGDPLLYAFK
jgi:hypothetical protein